MGFGVWFAWQKLTLQILAAVIIWFQRFNAEAQEKGWVYPYYYCFSTEGDRK